MKVWLKSLCLFVIGGACGYGSAVKEIPFQSKISTGSLVLIKYGKGCGACYQVCIEVLLQF